MALGDHFPIALPVIRTLRVYNRTPQPRLSFPFTFCTVSKSLHTLRIQGFAFPYAQGHPHSRERVRNLVLIIPDPQDGNGDDDEGGQLVPYLMDMSKLSVLQLRIPPRTLTQTLNLHHLQSLSLQLSFPNVPNIAVLNTITHPPGTSLRLTILCGDLTADAVKHVFFHCQFVSTPGRSLQDPRTLLHGPRAL